MINEAATFPARGRSRAMLALAALASSSACRRMAAAGAPGDGGSGRAGVSGDAAIEAAGTWAGLKVRTVGERRHPRQLVVLLHGWGAPGDDLVPFAEALQAPGRLLAMPAAPLVSPGGGRAWWHLDIERLLAARSSGDERALRHEVPPGLEAARTQVTALLAEASRRANVAPADVVIGGFSQGAMLSTDVALASPGAIGRLVVLSGSIVAEGAWTARLDAMAKSARFPVFMSHGRGDPVLPFAIADALHELFLRGQHDVTWLPFGGGHEIPQPVVMKLRAFLPAPPPAPAPPAAPAH